MPSLLIEELAQKIYDDSLAKVKENERYGIDPFTIIMIIAILVNVIRVIRLMAMYMRLTSRLKSTRSSYA